MSKIGHQACEAKELKTKSYGKGQTTQLQIYLIPAEIDTELNDKFIMNIGLGY